jgi:hypothetical protein
MSLLSNGTEIIFVKVDVFVLTRSS